MSESNDLAIRENFAALLFDIKKYREERKNIQNGLEKSTEEFNSTMQQDDVAKVLVPTLRNVIGVAGYKSELSSFRIASMIMSRANTIFPDEPLSMPLDEPIGYEVMDVPQKTNVSRFVSSSAEESWKKLGSDLNVGKIALEGIINTLTGAYNTSKDHLGGGNWTEELHNSFMMLNSIETDFGATLLKLSVQMDKIGDFIQRILNSGTGETGATTPGP